MSGIRVRRGQRGASKRPRKAIRALTSDVWFTLLYLPPKGQRALERARLKIWIDPLVRGGLSRYRAERAALQVEAWKGREEARGWTPTIEDQAERISRASGVKVPAREIGSLLDKRVAASNVRVAPGAIETLERLRGDGMRLGIVSNVLHETPEGLRELLDDLGLLSLFASVVLSSEHPWAKPRPEPFHLALAQLTVRPENAVHVGDLLYDVLGARRAGMRPLLYTGLHSIEPVHLLRLSAQVDPSVGRFQRWADLPNRLAGEVSASPGGQD